jgi:hypothetical protein
VERQIGLGVGGGVGLSMIILQQTRQKASSIRARAALCSFAPFRGWFAGSG